MCGTWDVDGMLAAMPSELFAEWIAYHQQEPWGDDWMQTSFICAVASNLLASKKSELVDLDHYLPKFGTEDKPPRRRVGIGEDEAAMRAVYGGE